MLSRRRCAPGLLASAGSGQHVARSCAAWRGHSLCRVNPAPCLPSLGAAGGCRVLSLSLPGQHPRRRLTGGGGPLPAAARAHAGLGTRRVRARARAPRLQPSSRSRLRCHSPFPGAAAASPGSRALSAGPVPLAPSQEDELEEDAWAREYRGGGPVGPERGRKMIPGLSPSPRAAPRPGPGSPPRTPAPAGPSPSPHRRKGGRQGERGKAPVSQEAGAGRKPPPVRLETVATATGLRSPATRLQGGDPLSPPPRGAEAPGDSPSRGGGNFDPLARLGVPASTAVEGGGGGRAAPWAGAGSHVAAVVAAGLLGWQQTWGRASPWASHGRRRHGSGVCARHPKPKPHHHHPPPAKWPDPSWVPQR